MNIKNIFFFCLILVSLSTSWSQTKSDLLKQAKDYYQQSNFIEASKLYDRLLNMQIKEDDLQMAANSFIKNRQIDKAALAYSQLITHKKKENYLLSYAECLHHSNQFYDAAIAYKAYLKKLKKSDHTRISIEQNILRALKGSKLKRKEKNAIVEPLSKVVNSAEDEFAPIPSRNHSGRYYFSAIRPTTKKEELGASKKLVIKNSELYSIEDNNGNWSVMKSLGAGFSSFDDERILDFIDNGNGLVFVRTKNSGTNAEVLVKHFDNVKKNEYSRIELPFNYLNSDRELCLFQDTVCIFSSKILGGYGGYDLYVSIHRHGAWSDPKNLGPMVNSSFDEVSPFLAKDGQTLYFSSNNLNSIGGLDVFKSEFLAESGNWSIPENLGLPINTASDESQFRLNRNGLSGVFTSDRKDLSLGGKDIFIAYFKDELEEQFYDESGTILSYFIDQNKTKESKIIVQSKAIKETQVENKSFVIDPVISVDDDYINAIKSQTTLQNISNILRQYPTLKIQCIGHSNESGNPMINLFTSVKKAEELAQALRNKNIDADRIQSIGVGSSYKIVQKTVNGLVNSQESSQNNRVEMFIVPNDKEKTNFTYSNIKVVDIFKNTEQYRFQNSRPEVSYSVLLGESTQMLNRDLSTLQNVELFCEYRNGKYYYYAGVYNKFYQALNLIKQYNLGNSTPVQAFFNGKYIDSASIINYATQYPDLILLIDYNKNKR